VFTRTWQGTRNVIIDHTIQESISYRYWYCWYSV